MTKPLQGIHVLLIDDDEVRLESLRQELTLGGALVTATRAAQALGAAVTADVIVYDATWIDAAGGIEFITRLASLHARGEGRVPTIGIGAVATPAPSGSDRRVPSDVSGEALRSIVLEVTSPGALAKLRERTAAVTTDMTTVLAAVIANAYAASRSLDRDPPDVATARAILADIITDIWHAAQVIRDLRGVIPPRNTP